MRLCLRVTDAGETPLKEIISLAAEAGFSRLDLSAPVLESYLADFPVTWLDARLQEHGLYVAAISGIELVVAYPASLVAPGPNDERLLTQAHFLELCTRLDALGGGLIIAHPGSHPHRETREQAMDTLVVRALRDLSDLAAPFDVQVVFEARGTLDGFESSVSASQDIVRRAGRSNIGLALDASHFCIEESTSQVLAALEPGELALVYQGDVTGQFTDAANVPNRMLPGCGGVPLKALGEFLAPKGFSGLYSVELPRVERLSLSHIVSAREAALALLHSE